MSEKKIISKSTLPWNFEAFREYITYEVLKNAAAVLYQYENELFAIDNPKIQEMQRLLALRTGKNAWLPSRKGTEDIAWNVEGDVYRNKGRLLTSMFILEPKSGEGSRIKLLPFGKALATGKVSENEFYDFIVSKYQFPHPAYEDNWAKWNEAGITLYPFAYILQTLVEIYNLDPTQAFISTSEVADHLHPKPDHSKIKEYSKNILKARKSKTGEFASVPRSDEIHRKINDMLGFLCISGYCHYLPNGNAALNLRARHKKEMTYYELRREGENRLESITELLKTISISEV